MRTFISIGSIAGLILLSSVPGNLPGDRYTEVLLEDDFEQLPSGTLSSGEGAHTEYHFLPELIPRGHWQVASFYHDKESERAWKVFSHEERKVMAQTVQYSKNFTHPMVIAGDSLWKDYKVSLRFAPQDTAQSGLMFAIGTAVVTIFLA